MSLSSYIRSAFVVSIFLNFLDVSVYFCPDKIIETDFRSVSVEGAEVAAIPDCLKLVVQHQSFSDVVEVLKAGLVFLQGLPPVGIPHVVGQTVLHSCEFRYVGQLGDKLKQSNVVPFELCLQAHSRLPSNLKPQLSFFEIVKTGTRQLLTLG
jgi:hypothetical protein